ncbi:MAG: serine protease [Rhodospirillales bacterium]|nr:serine protease [Rhodospirillales bacterium]
MPAFRLSALATSSLLLGFLAAACVTPQGAKAPRVQAASQAGAAAANAAASERGRMWRATVVVENARGHGSGVIIGQGRILTAYHVAEQGGLQIEYYGGERTAGRVGWSSPSLDLAVIETAVPRRYRASSLFCGEIAVDQHLVAIGHPLTNRWVLSEGSLRDDLDLGALRPLSFELSQGNSGGPIFDDAGRVVGIASAVLMLDRVEKTAAEAEAAKAGPRSGIGLMLPASAFCGKLDAA